MRALEIVIHTGKSIRHFQKNQVVKRPFNVIKLGIDPPKPILHQNIETRVHHMMENGQLNEVRGLLPHRHLVPLQTVGYQELFDHLDGRVSLAEATERIVIHTRQYAKRQMTWFKKDTAIQWLMPGDVEQMTKLANAGPA
jgi:tRNA dimethylallyltransferase